MEDRALSKFLSLVLRHKPEIIGIQPDRQGWVDLDELLTMLNAAGKNVSLENIEAVVAGNDKQRFKIDGTRSKIRASQGHSIAVDLGLKEVIPPEVLFHGTATRFLESIKKSGLEKRSRRQVHLSADEASALKVGQRHGRAVVLKVKARQMYTDGFRFFLSDNGVWLTDRVATDYLDFE